MYIRRDYTQPLFSQRRKRRATWWAIVLTIVLCLGFLFFVDNNFTQLQLMALDAIGQAPAPTPFASELATVGMDNFMRGDLVTARDYFRRAVMQQPTNVDYLYEYGRLLIELGVDDEPLYIEAIAAGDQAIQANPNDPRGYAIKARALDLSGDSPNAIPVAQAGVQIDAGFAPLHTALSSAYRSIDRYDVALDAAERAIELDPFDPAARRVYALALIWVGRRAEALDQLEQAVGLNPNLVSPYFELASMYRALAVTDTAQGQDYYELAIATYEQVISMQPGNAKAYLRLCEAYTQIGEHRRAQGYCEDALGLRADYSEAWRALGQTQYPQRNYEGAIESFETCVALQSARAIVDQEIECFYLRGLSHYYLADCAVAWDILSESVNRVRQTSTDPDNPVLINSLRGLELVTDNCTGFGGRGLPTAVPPTSIPPTPIGG
ncbi:MAG: tetratricopeptide repeat protein [Chloroflexota bacterium]|nr:tetratricopeptide repeat protein [Chloroflexota bacterium]